MMLDRYIRTVMTKRGDDYVFSCLDPLFATSNLDVANLEGPITSNISTRTGSRTGDGRNMVFTFATTTPELLHAHHIDLVGLGNNHILNFGWAGLASTTDALSAAGVEYFGDLKSQRIAEEDLHGVRVAFITYSQFSLSHGNASTTLEQIAQERARGYLPIVYPHWGGEYQEATTLQMTLVHAFIDAGAEAVIGSHPHVVQEHEMYKGKHIYYSLGNLIFDQYFDNSVTHGLLVRLTVVPDGVQNIDELPVVLTTDGRTCPADST